MADEQPEISNKALRNYVPESEVMPEVEDESNEG